MRIKPMSDTEQIKIAQSNDEMKPYTITISVSAKSEECVEDWFCRTVMGEVGFCEIEHFTVLED